MSEITIVILTFNESLHLERCIKSIESITNKIVIIDSFSTDDTLEIADRLNCDIYQHKFVSQAEQINWAIKNNLFSTEWIFRIDADEYIDRELQESITDALNNSEHDVNGYLVNRYINFLGRKLSYGGMSKYYTLRIWRNNKAVCEERIMDEHMVLSHGKSEKLKGSLTDHNLNDLSWWSIKHVNYSTREAVASFKEELSSDESVHLKASFFGTKSQKMRFLKGCYGKTPLFVRPFLYFIYRFFFQLGFMDGKEGLIWCILQGFWYRFLVDSKRYEISKTAKVDNISIREYINKHYGYKI